MCKNQEAYVKWNPTFIKALWKSQFQSYRIFQWISKIYLDQVVTLAILIVCCSIASCMVALSCSLILPNRTWFKLRIENGEEKMRIEECLLGLVQVVKGNRVAQVPGLSPNRDKIFSYHKNEMERHYVKTRWLYCNTTQILWSLVYSMFGVPWIAAESVSRVLASRRCNTI